MSAGAPLFLLAGPSAPPNPPAKPLSLLPKGPPEYAGSRSARDFLRRPPDSRPSQTSPRNFSATRDDDFRKPPLRILRRRRFAARDTGGLQPRRQSHWHSHRF